MDKQKMSIPTMECDSDESWKHFADKMKSITRDLEFSLCEIPQNLQFHRDRSSLIDRNVEERNWE
jgi:hypothetical protein